jgi:hypothetical protein
MIRHDRMEHRFVRHLPSQLEPGVLYISMEYATAAHSCCCGCGEEVVTPFTPTDWKMTYDGETVSLRPSIGNWSLACRSHYVIERGRVMEALPWTDEQVAAGRRMDRVAKDTHYGAQRSLDVVAPTVANESAQQVTQSILSRVRGWASRRRWS